MIELKVNYFQNQAIVDCNAWLGECCVCGKRYWYPPGQGWATFWLEDGQLPGLEWTRYAAGDARGWHAWGRGDEVCSEACGEANHGCMSTIKPVNFSQQEPLYAIIRLGVGAEALQAALDDLRVQGKRSGWPARQRA